MTPGQPPATSPAEGKPLRVLLVAPLAADDGGTTTGGVATHVSDLARQLATLGHEVAVYADNLPAGEPSSRAWGTAYPPVASSALISSAVTMSGGLATLARAMRDSRALKMRPASAAAHALGLRRALLAASPDVVHYHHAETRPAFGRMADVRAPGVITVHSLSAFRDEGGSGMRELALHNLAAADAVITVSDDAAEVIATHLPDLSVQVVPNGIDVAAFSQNEPARPAEAPAGPLVLYLGWIATYKGVLDAVEAMATVRQRVPGASLAVVGPEIDLTRDAVREAWDGPAEALVTLAPVSQPGVIGWLRAADVMVLPSRVREGGPRVLLEAFAAGTPVVACDVGAVGAVLEHGALGALVASADPAALADAIVEALCGSEATARRTKAARDAVASYDSAALTQRVVDVYRTAIASGATR